MSDFEEKKKRAAEWYSSLTDEELKLLADEAWSLTDAGKQALQAELARRSLVIVLAAAPPPEVPPNNLVALRKFRDMPEALLAQGALESAGIESSFMDETTIRMDWLWSDAMGGIKLRVKAQDADAAAQLLDQEILEKFGVEGAGEFEQPRCPKCNSLNISFRDLDKWCAYGGMMVGLPIPVKDERWKCQTCGYEWHTAEEPKQNP
jgi:hypothetical protein